MSKYFILLTPILALVTLNLAACMNTSSMINDVPTTPTLNDGQVKEPYSLSFLALYLATMNCANSIPVSIIMAPITWITDKFSLKSKAAKTVAKITSKVAI